MFSNDDIHARCLAALGRQTKIHRKPGEQFCTFAFDLHLTQQLIPPVGLVDRAKTMRIGGAHSATQQEVTNWLTAYWQNSAPIHTERRVLGKFERWYDRYSAVYGRPQVLYIYSFLIPCQRDGTNGNCADAIADMLLTFRNRGQALKLCMGWSNDDRDSDMATATRDVISSLQDDGCEVLLYPHLSIAR